MIKYIRFSIFFFLIFFSGMKMYSQHTAIDSLISVLTLEEKASLLSGKTAWDTQGIDRLNIPSILMTDGPHGVRKNKEFNLVLPSDPSTCFPTASLEAATWDKELIFRMGQALGQEARYHQVNMLLGPGVNIKRSPLGGRNFEYFSEDPLLAGVIAKAYIQGVQSQGVGTSLKHFVANDQETDRMIASSEVDERTLREIYLRPFEIAVEAQPSSIMCAYNKLNGTYCTENKWLISDVLRKEFGFKGLCVSDWGAVNDRIKGIMAGLDLQMPTDHGYSSGKIIEAVKTNKLSTQDLDLAVRNVLKLVFSLSGTKSMNEFDQETSHQLARKIASEGTVLLKNINHILPLDKSIVQDIAIIGKFAKNPRFQGAGSSLVNPTQLNNLLGAMENMKGKKYRINYSDGYDIDGQTNDSLLNEAMKLAKKSKVVLIVAGLPDRYESEGFDRTSLDMPDGHNKLIQQLASVSKNVVVILQNGSPVTMPWLNEVQGVVEAYLGGQAGGLALADILFGNVNPSGKLAETFPKKLNDTPAFLTWPGESHKTYYGEGVFVGYRFYDVKDIEPLFPFGYGLSYTDFEYSNLKIDKKEFNETDSLVLHFDIRNTGKREGKEIVQLYLRDKNSKMIKPIRELKAFEKLNLLPGESKSVTMTLKIRDFQNYNVQFGKWIANSGEYEILIGSSSRDLRLNTNVLLNIQDNYSKKFDINSTMSEISSSRIGEAFVNEMLKMGKSNVDIDKLSESERENALKQQKMNEETMLGLTLKKVIILSRGRVSEEKILELVEQMNNETK